MVKSEPEENDDMFDPDYEVDSSINENSSGKKKRLLSRTNNSADDNIEDLEIDETSHSQSRGKINDYEALNLIFSSSFPVPFPFLSNGSHSFPMVPIPFQWFPFLYSSLIAKPFKSLLRPGICVECFLLFPQKSLPPEKTAIFE